VKLISSRRIGIAIAIPVVVIAGAVLATANLQRATALRGAREQAATQGMLTAMLDQETGARGFFQTRARTFLQPWYRGTGAFESNLAELRSLLGRTTPALQRSLLAQEQRARDWHAIARSTIRTLELTNRSQSIAQASRAKKVMDSFRAANAAFDRALSQNRNHSLATATTVAVAVAVALAALLAAAGLLLTRRMAHNEEHRQRDQAELRELLQASKSEQESRDLLIQHVEKLIPKAGASVLNRNNSDDRLEIALSGRDSALRDARTEQMRPRSCMAVRLSHSHDRRPGDRRLQECEICGKIAGTTTCEPLLVGGQVIGSVLVASRQPIDADRRARLRESVAQAAPILANQRNLAIAEMRASSDALTGLPNRRAADETLKRMAAQAARSAQPLTAILLDLDRFKQVNDRHGHASGDRTLALVASIVQSTIRTSDFAARYGGEEFIVLLPDTDGDVGAIVAEKLRGEIASAELAGVGAVSASFGLAVLPTDAGEPDELLRRADRALYAAKEGGRNCVRAFADSVAGAERPLIS
jgi:diguanylate cyclase (GGDEF)-like protein